MRLIFALALILAIHLTVPPGDPAALAWAGTAADGEPTPHLGETSITVMTVNLGNGLVEPDDLVSYLHESEFDLVSLLEVTPGIAEALDADLGDIFPYREVRALGIPGKALLSRYPITRAEWLELNPGRPDLLATVDLGGRPVDVLVAHPPPPEVTEGGVQQREGTVAQFDRIIEIAAEAEHPFLLLGDLNVTSVQQRHRELESIGLVDVFGAVGCGPGFTFPRRIPQLIEIATPPVLRIDYIWASADWQLQSAIVGEDIGSDHLPVVAQLALLDEPVAGDTTAEDTRSPFCDPWRR